MYIFYSPAAPPTEPDSASESTVFGTLLYCKAAQDMASFVRYGFRQLVHTVIVHIAQSTELSIHKSLSI